MIESEWLEIIKKVRGNSTWGNFCMERQQFDTFFDALKEFDVRHVREAADRIIKGYAYPPIVATFTVYIEQVQKDEQYRADRERAEKKELEDAKRKPSTDDKGWLKFGCYMLREKIKWPKRPDGSIDEDEVEKLKAKFEKEHPNWQPRKRRQVKRGGMTQLGQSLGDAMGKLK